MADRVITDGATRTLVQNGIPASQIDLGDPTRLEFPYMRRIADVLDVMAPAGRSLRALHLGAGLGALAGYLDATRPASSSDLVDVVRHRDDLDVELADARAAVQRRPKRTFDVVIGDVYDGPVTPRHLTTLEFLAEVRRVLRPGGVYVVNLIDDPPHRLARRQVATLIDAFSETVLLAERPVLSGRRTGNLVAAAADRTLPVAKLAKRSRDVLDREGVELWCEGAKPLRD
jgi:spermidine synthase